MLLRATLTLLLTWQTALTLAQTVVNGQVYTNGLAIINAPAINSEHNYGGNIPISIEVSGNGRIPEKATQPGSGLETTFESLNIFLVSAETKTNLTVSSGLSLLTKETGSVRHLDYVIPSCVRTGKYNMTFYEVSTWKKEPLFVITPIPITIRNTSPSSEECGEGVNELLPQPQVDASAAQSPFLDGNTSAATTLSCQLTLYSFIMSLTVVVLTSS